MAGNRGLSDTFIKNLRDSDQKKHFDGGGLYLYLTNKGGRRFTIISSIFKAPLGNKVQSDFLETMIYETNY